MEKGSDSFKLTIIDKIYNTWTKRKKKSLLPLLSNDITSFRNFLPEIQNFSDKDIDTLWEGNLDYNYPSHQAPHNGPFRNLILKFQNFCDINNEYYQKQDHQPFLIDLWKKYLSTKDLKKLSENQRIKKVNK